MALPRQLHRGLISASGLYTAPASAPGRRHRHGAGGQHVSPSAIGTAASPLPLRPRPRYSVPWFAELAARRRTNVAVTLAGSNFQAGATIAIGGTGVSAGQSLGRQSHEITADLRHLLLRRHRRP